MTEFNSVVQNTFFTRLQLERKNQEEKHGNLDGTMRSMSCGEWLPILVEEVGEVGTAIMDYHIELRNYHYEGGSSTNDQLVEIRLGELISELVQVAATCMAFYEDLVTRGDFQG